MWCNQLFHKNFYAIYSFQEEVKAEVSSKCTKHAQPSQSAFSRFCFRESRPTTVIIHRRRRMDGTTDPTVNAAIIIIKAGARDNLENKTINLLTTVMGPRSRALIIQVRYILRRSSQSADWTANANHFQLRWTWQWWRSDVGLLFE